MAPIVLFLLALLPASLCAELRISDVQGLIDLSRTVNNGTNFSGTTVLLDSDIDFSGSYSELFAPIGLYNENGDKKPFQGTFDGQGHAINNLNMSTLSESTGLFGFSRGTTIRNVVIGDSCSFANFLSTNDGSIYPYIGSVFGVCFSLNTPCTIQGVVNMGRVSFTGDGPRIVFTGGIIGAIVAREHPSFLKNCVNYGPITHTGSCSFAEIGGITGISDRKVYHYNRIQNCLNYGTITFSGLSSYIIVGGIAGNSIYGIFENCVNSGRLSLNKESNHIGGILGGIANYAEITHCFWTIDFGNIGVYGVNEGNVNVTESSLSTLNQTVLDDLNRYARTKDDDWENWVMLYLNGGRINDLDKESVVGIQGSLPVPMKEGNSLMSWYKNSECTDRFDPEIDNTSEISALYAGLGPNNYTATFDLGNGTIVEKSFIFNTSVEYPRIIVKEGFTLSWNTNLVLMPARDITATALWIPNIYTVSFDSNGGSELTISSKTVTFNSTYGDLPTPSKEDFRFIGWFTENNESVTNETVVVTANNHTLHAQWKEIQPGFVEIVFEKKEISEEEIRDVANKYTNAEFTIQKIEVDKSGEIRVIIKFDDSENAKSFVETIKTSSNATERVEYIPFYKGDSLSMGLHPMMEGLIIFLL